MTVVSVTDEVAGLTLYQAMRAATATQRPRGARRRPLSRFVWCRKLVLEGDWGVVRMGEIIPRDHPAVDVFPEWFEETSIGAGLDPEPDELEHELQVRRARLAALKAKTRPQRPSAGRAISRRFITPTPHPSPTKRVECPWTVTLRPDAKARFTIHLEGETARTILAEVADVSHEGLETGGLLLSWEQSRTEETRIVYASGAGNGSLHGPRSLLLAREEDVRAAFPVWLDGDALRRIGCWHYHPVAGVSRPSTADLNAWASYLFRADAGCIHEYPAIIVCPGGAGGPRFYGWVTRRAEKHGRYVCEPAEVRDKWGYAS